MQKNAIKKIHLIWWIISPRSSLMESSPWMISHRSFIEIIHAQMISHISSHRDDSMDDSRQSAMYSCDRLMEMISMRWYLRSSIDFFNLTVQLTVEVESWQLIVTVNSKNEQLTVDIKYFFNQLSTVTFQLSTVRFRKEIRQKTKVLSRKLKQQRKKNINWYCAVSNLELKLRLLSSICCILACFGAKTETSEVYDFWSMLLVWIK